MKKWYLICVSFCLANYVIAQNLTKINNTVTAQHQRVVGSKVYMIPPPNFEQVLGSVGFKQVNANNSIIVRESAGGYKELVQTFMTENFAVKGLKLLQQEKIMLNGSEATYIQLTQKVHKTTFKKNLLFFGDTEQCVLISAVFDDANDNELEGQIKKSMLSVAYKQTDETFPMPQNYTLDFKTSGLKYARRIADAVIYTADGNSSTNALIKKSFFAGSGKLDNTDVKTFGKERLEKQIKTPINITANEAVTIGGLNGYEIVATTSVDNQTRTLYQLILVDGNTYYIMYGSTTDADATSTLAMFKKIAHSFAL